ncbi:MAG: hypothetical protein V3T21_05005 [Candidatus Margulisiibacteriota bacterium]
MLTLRGGINKTKQRLDKAGYPSPLPKVRVANNTARTQEIQRLVTTEGPRMAASYLYAEGIQEIIIEDKVSIEHELWHIYLKSAFPEYNNAIKHLELILKIRFPFLINNFLKRFEHFFLRSAAIEAGRYEFAANDSKLELDLALSQIQELRDNPMEIASSYTGMILAHAFPFRSYTPLFTSNRERIKDNALRLNMFRAFYSHDMALFRGRIKEIYKGSSDENIFSAFYEHAKSIWKFCQEDKGEIRMEDLTTPVHCLWSIFMENYFPALL